MPRLESSPRIQRDGTGYPRSSCYTFLSPPLLRSEIAVRRTRAMRARQREDLRHGCRPRLAGQRRKVHDHGRRISCLLHGDRNALHVVINLVETVGPGRAAHDLALDRTFPSASVVARYDNHLGIDVLQGEVRYRESSRTRSATLHLRQRRRPGRTALMVQHPHSPARWPLRWAACRRDDVTDYSNPSHHRTETPRRSRRRASRRTSSR